MNKYAHRVWIALALLVAALGMRGLNADAIWYDEWWSLYYAGAIDGDTSPGAVLARLSEQRQHENNPPLYYLLLAQWGQLLNWTPQTAPLIGRFLSLAATLLAGRHARFAGWGLAVAEALVSGPLEIAIVGDPADARTRALHGAALASPAPGAVITVGTGEAAGDVPLLRGRTPVDGAPAAYVCRNFTCRLPVTTPADLMAELAGG